MSKFTVRFWFTPNAIQDADGPSEVGTIHMQCERIDDELRGKGRIGLHDGIVVRSISRAAINDNEIYLRGTDKEDDNRIIHIVGDTTLLVKYKAACVAAGGEVIDGPPPVDIGNNDSWTGPEPIESDHLECTISIDCGNMNTFIPVYLTRDGLAKLVSDLIKKG